MDGRHRLLQEGEDVHQETAQLNLIDDAIGKALYCLAHDQFSKGDFAACMKTVDELTSQYPQSMAAPVGGVLRVTVKLNQYTAVPDGNRKEKAEALQAVIESAKLTTNTWPGRPEADDARMTLGQAYRVNHEIDKALKQFGLVNARSERYPTAQYLVGETTWYHRYLPEKQKPEAKRDREAMAAARKEAVEAMTTSVTLQSKLLAASAPMPPPLIEAELLLAEMHMEGSDPKGAAELYKPLIKAAKDAAPDRSRPAPCSASFWAGSRLRGDQRPR